LLRKAWTLAIETLSWIELQHLGERLALTKAAKQLKIQDTKVVGLAHKLVFETLRRRNLLDFIINQALAPNMLGDFKLGPQAFLRLYTYETRFVNSGFSKAWSIARARARLGRSILGWRALKGVEEALGRILGIQFDGTLKKVDLEERVALLTYNPLWFVKYCFQLLGRSDALRFLESATQQSRIYLRINLLKASEERILKELESEGIRIEKVPKLKHTYKLLEAKKPLVRTRSFREGLLYIQDMASCLAAEIANPESGMTVLDVCAAPGAKTAYMVQLMQNKGKIFSIDYSRRRMHIWKRQIKRMDAKIAVPFIADAGHTLPLRLSAKLVILDPPCTSTGTFSKTPSAKWRLTKRSVLHMAQTQWRMLQQCAEHVKEEGHLVYSTCSITLEENEMLIEKFLKWYPEFTLVETQPRIGLPGLRGQAECQRLYPHLHNCNGFFIAKLLKTG
jgi:16S rRNA (cytosine967-C5)-methyltransferase